MSLSTVSFSVARWMKGRASCLTARIENGGVAKGGSERLARDGQKTNGALEGLEAGCRSLAIAAVYVAVACCAIATTMVVSAASALAITPEVSTEAASGVTLSFATLNGGVSR